MAREFPIYHGLLAGILALVVALSGGILLTTSFASRRTVETLSQSVIDQAAGEVEVRLHAFLLDPAARVLGVGRHWAAAGRLDLERPEELVGLLAPLLAELPQVSAFLLADDQGREFMLLRRQNGWRSRETRPDLWSRQVRLREWRSAAGGPSQQDERFEVSDYSPLERPWYRGAARAAPGSMRWTAPYVFATKVQLGITASTAALRGDTRYVIGLDLLLDDLSSFTRSLSSERQRVFVLTEQGKVVAYPGRASGGRMLESPDRLGLTVLATGIRAIEAAALEPGTPARFERDGRGWWGALRSLALAGDLQLVIGVVTPESALTGDLGPLRLGILLVTVVVLGLAAAGGLALARLYSRPIEALVRGADRIGHGDLDHAEPVPTRVREYRRLARAQDRMRSALGILMKMERDLQVARQIQQQTLPRDLPQPVDFEIEAWSEPADETGGDTYDILKAQAEAGGQAAEVLAERPDQVVALLADATGHGIGPALSVTQVRAMLRMGIRSGLPLRELLLHMNEQLCADLEGGRFITAWIGELDAKAGTLRTVSAGQAPIVHYRAREDRFEFIEAQGPPLGVATDVTFDPSEALVLEPGDLYAVFSDGVYEARDPDGATYDEERVLALLRRLRGETVHRILEALREDLRRFTRGTPPHDDQTGILIKRL